MQLVRVSEQQQRNSGTGDGRVADRTRTVFVCVAWLVTSLVASLHEIPRFTAAIKSPAGVFGWFYGMDADWSLAFVVLLTLPLFLVMTRLANWNSARQRSVRRTAVESPVAGRVQVVRRAAADHLPADAGSIGHVAVAASVHSGKFIPAACLTAVALFCLSLVSSASIGLRSVSLKPVPGQTENISSVRFFELPPAYHDEFSYLLQARTFLAGRLSWPAMTVQPDLFHQVHVLNRPTTASRYFPWTGLWMAPFVALGYPSFGHWLAGAIACVFFHRSLCHMMEFRWAAVGGILIAASPGLAAFSNLLLAHHPTMMALSVFLWAFLRFMDRCLVMDAVVAGTALSLAMLGRPMTAAGFALPFGVWLLMAMIRQQWMRSDESSKTWSPGRVLAGFGIPLLLGFGVLALMNHATTGNWMKSAYQLYTDTWTPRHRYGFDNANIDPSLPESKVLQSYDAWAENLTIEKAESNVEQRTLYSLRWTLGIAALTFSIIASLSSCLSFRDRRPLLLLCSVLALHAVHIPYWYDGIMHWHYVFETAPLLIMLATFGLRAASLTLQTWLGTRLSSLWLTSLLLASLIPNWFDADTFWGPSRVTTAFREQAFSRVRFEYFRRLTMSTQIQHPALILVDEGSSNPQLSYIINPPDLSGEVIVCRLPNDASIVDELTNAFPDHHLYAFNPETFELSPINQHAR